MGFLFVEILYVMWIVCSCIVFMYIFIIRYVILKKYVFIYVYIKIIMYVCMY